MSEALKLLKETQNLSFAKSSHSAEENGACITTQLVNSKDSLLYNMEKMAQINTTGVKKQKYLSGMV